MYDMRASGAIAFSDGLHPVQSAGLLVKALQYVRAFDGGDLRVAHFVGLHLMQVMPFAAWLLHKRAAPATTRRVVIAIAATGTLLTAAAFAQALAGRPLIGA